MASAVTQSPPTNWVKLELEAVQVNIDADDSLNFATVQSVVPGAHGLYFRENGERKALVFDNNTGKILPPTSGWNDQPIFIHLAHGHRHGTHFADYSQANDQFEKNVSAVQKLFASAGLIYNKKSKSDKPRGSSQSRKTPKSGYEAQAEGANHSEESDHTKDGKAKPVAPAEPKEGEIEKLKKKNAEIKDKLKAVKAELAEAQEKIKTLEETNKLQEENLVQIPIETKIDEAEYERHALEQNEKDEEINNLHSVIEDLRDRLAKSESEGEDNRSKLDESQELLKNAKEKVNYLEGQLSNNDIVINVPQKGRSRPPSESHDDAAAVKIRSLETKLTLSNNVLRQLESEKQKLQESNWYANERLAKLEQENGYLKGASDQLKARLESSQVAQLLEEKDKRIWELVDEKSKQEWRLGELTQWWNDAKWKVGELESSIAQQKNLLETANEKIQSLNERLLKEISNRTSSISTFSPPQSTNGFSLKQTRSGAWQLASDDASQSFSTPVPYVLPGFSTVPSIPAYPSFASFPQQSEPIRTVTLTYENLTESEVFVVGSFTNWQCALNCNKLFNGKKGVQVALARGRYEFRFLIDGKWTASNDFQQLPNGFGGNNNVINVD